MRITDLEERLRTWREKYGDAGTITVAVGFEEREGLLEEDILDLFHEEQEMRIREGGRPRRLIIQTDRSAIKWAQEVTKLRDEVRDLEDIVEDLEYIITKLRRKADEVGA